MKIARKFSEEISGKIKRNRKGKVKQQRRCYLEERAGRKKKTEERRKVLMGKTNKR